MIRRQLWIVLIAVVFLLAGHVSADQDEDNLRSYVELSTENHLLAADFMLGEMLQSPESPLDPEKREYLEQARSQCQEALRKFAYSGSEDEVLLTDDWWAHFNATFPEDETYTDITDSPLSLLAHLYLAFDSAQQSSAQAMISSQQYTEQQARLIDMLDESVEVMNQAVESAQMGMGSTVYSFADGRFFIEIPADYSPQSTSYQTPVSTAKRLPDGSLQRVVLVSMIETEWEIPPREFMEGRNAALVAKFADLSDFVVEDASGDGYEVRATYSFTYGWEGDQIKALIYAHKSGNQSYEVNCLSLADHFDRAECDRIFDSFIAR